MKVVYEPSGKAAEYAELACNLRLTCSHGCTFCFCPAMLHKPREEFYKAGPPRPGILEDLEKDCKRMAEAQDRRRILLSFIGDCYAPEEQSDQTTRYALEIIAAHGLNASVLTKGGLRAERDFDIMAEAGVWFGTTLTCQMPSDSRGCEPGAALPNDRKRAICIAHEAGIFTWVSLEPVLYPEDSLSFISELAEYVDYWHVGRLNYHPHAKEIDWPNFAEKAWRALVEVDASFRFKDGLAKDLRAGRYQQSRTMDEAAAAGGGADGC